MTKRFRLSFVNAAEDVPRVIRAYGRACGGEFALVLRPTESTGILVHVSKQGAVQWTPRDGRDAPAFPEEATTSEDAVAAVKEAQKRPGRQGPITLRGQWSGYLHCDGNVPVVELRRKLATYAVLTIASRPEEGVWAWKVERLERWFGGPVRTLARRRACCSPWRPASQAPWACSGRCAASVTAGGAGRTTRAGRRSTQ